MKKTLIFFLFILSTFIYAQDDSFFFEEDFSEEEEEATGLPVTVGGVVGLGGYIIPDFDSFADSQKSVEATVDLDILVETSNIDYVMNLNGDLIHLDNADDFPLQDNPTGVSAYIDTMFVRYYHELFDMEVGYLKPVWGNADGIHVVDVLNPIDYSDYFRTMYLERKISQQMIKFNIPVGDSSLLELVYLPTFKGDNIPLSGIWTPSYLKNMNDTIFQMVYMANPSAPLATLQSMAAAISGSMNVEESTYFEDSQVSARFTSTVNSFDLGFTYYWGFLKKPTIDPVDVLTTGKLSLIYNRTHTFGLDAAGQLGPFNLKAEGAYELTDDFEGDDPGIMNNSINYILGFDINLPVNNVNLLVQGVGSTIINSNEITVMDPQYNKDERYTDLMVMGRVSDNYINETLYLEFAAAFDIFNKDYMLHPEAKYKINDNTDIILDYLFLGGEDDTDFGQYNDNDMLTLKVEYHF